MVVDVVTIAGVLFIDHLPGGLITVAKPDLSTKIQFSRKFISDSLYFWI
jgi:hypothetical protein